MSLTQTRLSWLLRAFLVYLALPVQLFLLSLPLPSPLRLLLCLAGLGLTARALTEVRRRPPAALRSRVQIRLGFLVLFMGSLLWTDAGLLWGRTFVHDWPKHRGLLHCLYLNPVNPSVDGFDLSKVPDLRGARLSYYYGFYLPSAYLTRSISWVIPRGNVDALLRTLDLVFLAWLMAGVTFVALLLPSAWQGLWGWRRQNVWGASYMLLFVFSGLNFWCKHLGWVVSFLGGMFSPEHARAWIDRYMLWWQMMFCPFPTGGSLHAEWFTPFFAQVSSFISDWQWAPQHLLSCLAAMVVLGLYRRELDRFPLAFWSTTCLVTSIFCWLGSLPILFMLMAQFLWEPGPKDRMARFRRWLWSLRLEGPLTLALGLVALWFYNLVPKSVLATNWTFSFTESTSKPHFISWNPTLFLMDTPTRLILFYVVEFLPILVILLIPSKRPYDLVRLPWFCLLFISALCLVTMGGNNDLVMRGSIPALLIILFFVVSKARDLLEAKGLGRIAVAVYLILVIPCCLNELVMGWQCNSKWLERDPVVIRQYGCPLPGCISSMH